MDTLNRGILYKAVAAVAVLFATVGWIWLLYVLVTWLFHVLYPS